MATRTYTFTTGIETSDAPTGAAPSATGDIMTLGYADTTYARRRDWGFTAADYTALKAIGTTGDNQRYDGQTRLVTGTGEIWRFDSASSATEDGSTILAPTSGTGRWLIVSGGSGSGGGSGSALELLTLKQEQEFFDGKLAKLDDSVSYSFNSATDFSSLSGSLLESYVSGGSTMTMVWDPKVVNDSDQNIDATTNWTAVGAGASLTTSATVKTGTASLSFDKNNTDTKAGIRYDRSSQNLGLGAHWRAFFYVNLSSITNLSNIYIRVYADTTSNYAQWNLSSSYNGTALATGWNFMFADLSTTPTSTGGTGWTKNTLARYVEVGVNTSSSAQTYTAVLVDSLYFSFGEVRRFGVIGSQFTIFDSSKKDNVTVDISNVSGDGILTLGSSLSNSYTGGLGGSSAGRIKRSTLTQLSQGATIDTALSSGTISGSQEFRIASIMRESKSGNYSAYADIYQPEVFEVKNISGSNVSGIDFGNVSANCLSGDSFDLFSQRFFDNNGHYIYKGSVVLTGNSSYDSTNAYINLPLSSTASVSGGDILAKRSITTNLSLVALTANENFISEDLKTEPNNIEVIDISNPIPQQNKLYAFWRMGGVNDTDAYVSRGGTLSNSLSTYKAGTINTGAEFLKGRFAASNFSSSNYFEYVTASNPLGGNSGAKTMGMLWYYGIPFTGTTRVITCCHQASGNNDQNFWHLYAGNTTNVIGLAKVSGGVASSEVTLPFKTNQWNFIAFSVESGVAGFLYVNGQYTALGTGSIGAVTTAFMLGRSEILSTPLALNSSDRLAEVLLWSGATDLSQAQLDAVYNGGNYRPFSYGQFLRYRYEMIGGSGQKLSMKSTLTRRTSVYRGSFINKLGMIKT